MNMETEGQPKRRFIPIPKWEEFHPYPSEGGMRWLAFNRETNGFADAFKKIGRRIVVDETAFFECIDAQNDSK